MNKLLLSIFVAISTVTCALAQPLWNPEGRPDRSFGEDGYALIGPGNTDFMAGSEVKPDGRIVWVHTIVGSQTMRIVVVGQLENGDPDPSFGKFGTKYITLSGTGWGTAMALQPDGKILVAGHLYGQSFRSNFFVLRLSAVGDIDPTFGNGGMVVLDMPVETGQVSYDMTDSLLAAPDGKIILAGTSDQRPASAERGNLYAVLARFNADGSLDGTFGKNGISKELFGTNTYPGDSGIFTIRFQSDGKIIGGIGAQREDPNSPGNFLWHGFVVRYLANGELDPSFSDDGILEVTPGTFGRHSFLVKEVSNGKLLVLAYFQAQLLRVTPEGSLDTTFGFGGRVQLTPGPSADFEIARENKIIILPERLPPSSGWPAHRNRRVGKVLAGRYSRSSIRAGRKGNDRLGQPTSYLGTIQDR